MPRTDKCERYTFIQIPGRAHTAPIFPAVYFLFLCLREPAAGGIMLSGCPSIRPSVCLSVLIRFFFEWEGKTGRGGGDQGLWGVQNKFEQKSMGLKANYCYFFLKPLSGLLFFQMGV